MEQEGHPEEANPLGESHARHTRGERRAMQLLSTGLVLGIVLIPILSVTTYSPLGNVFLGLSPFLVTLVLCLVAVGNHYKRHVSWLILVLVHLAALGLLWYANELLRAGLQVGPSVSTSVLLSAAFVFLAYIADTTPEEKREAAGEFSVGELPAFVRSLEDKAKGLNFAIGRVYRNSNGGSAKLRARVRILREWYNEFNHAGEADRVRTARVVVKKIQDRLLLYREEERVVFSEEERKRFKNVRRKKDGSSTVLSVLVENDSDPVEQYYESALELCEKILEGLRE